MWHVRRTPSNSTVARANVGLRSSHSTIFPGTARHITMLLPVASVPYIRHSDVLLICESRDGHGELTGGQPSVVGRDGSRQSQRLTSPLQRLDDELGQHSILEASSAKHNRPRRKTSRNGGRGPGKPPMKPRRDRGRPSPIRPILQ